MRTGIHICVQTGPLPDYEHLKWSVAVSKFKLSANAIVYGVKGTNLLARFRSRREVFPIH